MKKPDPEPGLVIRYDYLWRDEQKRGRIEGAKDRPCAIIIASKTDDQGHFTVILAPITHSAPQQSAAAIEIPPQVKKASRDGRCAILDYCRRSQFDVLG